MHLVSTSVTTPLNGESCMSLWRRVCLPVVLARVVDRVQTKLDVHQSNMEIVVCRGDRGWLSHGLVVTLPISYSLAGWRYPVGIYT